MFLKRPVFLFCLLTVVVSCNNGAKTGIPVIGFMDAFEDITLSKARKGFTDALRENGFSEEKNTVKILYRNAQGEIPALTQIANYYISQKVDLIATCPTLSTITALQRTQTIPVFMMVSPTAKLMKITGPNGKAPVNLFGAGEDLAYIDTSISIIPALIRPKMARLRIGMIYNQAEPQSVDALARIKTVAGKFGAEVIALPVNNSSEAQLVTQALLTNNLDAFFANPDNTVFAAFDIILKNCRQKKVPVFTSEAGLVTRGAVAAYGADIYQWGHQAGEQAARYLKTHSTTNLAAEMVRIRSKVFNVKAGADYGLQIPAGYRAIN